METTEKIVGTMGKKGKKKRLWANLKKKIIINNMWQPVDCLNINYRIGPNMSAEMSCRIQSMELKFNFKKRSVI